MYSLTGGDDIYLFVKTYCYHPKHYNYHINKNEISAFLINNTKNIFSQLYETCNYINIGKENSINIKSYELESYTIYDEKRRHYIIEESNKNVYGMNEKNLIKIYEKKNEIYFICDRKKIGKLFCSKLNIIKQLGYAENAYDNIDIKHIINENNGRKTIKKNMLVKILEKYYPMKYTNYYLDNQIKIYDHNDNLIINIEKEFIVYDLKNEIVLENIIINKYIGEIFEKIHYIQKINNHQYFLIMELKNDYKINSFNKISSDNDISISIVISNTAYINDYHDMFFKFL